MSTAKAKSATARALPADDAAKTVTQAVAAGRDRLETVARVSTDAAAQGYEKAVALTKERVEAAVKAQDAAFRSYEDAVQAARDNVEAVVKAGTILAQGLQDLGKEVMGLAQASIEDGVAASKALMGARTLRDVVDLQAGLARTGLDRLLGEGSRLSDRSVRLVEEAFAPITARVGATVDKLVKTAA